MLCMHDCGSWTAEIQGFLVDNRTMPANREVLPPFKQSLQTCGGQTAESIAHLHRQTPTILTAQYLYYFPQGCDVQFPQSLPSPTFFLRFLEVNTANSCFNLHSFHLEVCGRFLFSKHVMKIHSALPSVFFIAQRRTLVLLILVHVKQITLNVCEKRTRTVQNKAGKKGEKGQREEQEGKGAEGAKRLPGTSRFA